MAERQNAADEAKIRAQRAGEKLDDEQLMADLSVVLSSRAGRNVLWSLLEKANVYGSSFHEDSNWMAFREGNRNAGLHLLMMIQDADPKAYVAMIQEHQIPKKSDKNPSDTEREDG